MRTRANQKEGVGKSSCTVPYSSPHEKEPGKSLLIKEKKKVETMSTNSIAVTPNFSSIVHEWFSIISRRLTQIHTIHIVASEMEERALPVPSELECIKEGT